MAAFTGLRLEDCAHIKWADVDLAEKIIRTTPSKTKRLKREVVIPMHPDLSDFLLSHSCADNPESPVFPTLATVPVGGSTGLSAIFTGTVMKAAKVSRGQVREIAENATAGRTIYSRSFHSLRHTFTSWLANSNVPSEVRMKMTGHTTAAIHEVYTHINTDVLKSAIDGLDSLS
jgi:integrase